MAESTDTDGTVAILDHMLLASIGTPRRVHTMVPLSKHMMAGTMTGQALKAREGKETKNTKKARNTMEVITPRRLSAQQYLVAH